MSKLNFLILSLFTVFLMACSSENQGKSVEEVHKTLIIGHRSTGVGVNDGFLENTLSAIKEALKYVDGVEADIQMSASNTPWIFHDDLFNNLCEESDSLLKAGGYSCILNTPDSIIEKIRICKDGVKERFYKLEELFEVLSKDKSKIVSLDIKGYYDGSCISTKNVSEEYLDTLAKAIYSLAIKYEVIDQIIAETDYYYIFKSLKTLDKISNAII